MTFQPFSYLCRNEVHRFLGLEKRMDLIKSVPALRSQNKRLGYQINEVFYSREIELVQEVTFKLNDVWISIKEEKNDEKSGVIVEFRINTWSSTPFKRAQLCEKIAEMAEKMIAFYLDRPGTVVLESLYGIQFEHLRKWRNCIRTHRFTTPEHISTREWWCELFGRVRAPELHLKYDKTPGALRKIIEFINSNLPIGTSVTLYNLERNDTRAVQSLRFAGATIVSEWNKYMMVVPYPGYCLTVQLRPSYNRGEELTVRKRRTEAICA